MPSSDKNLKLHFTPPRKLQPSEDKPLCSHCAFNNAIFFLYPNTHTFGWVAFFSKWSLSGTTYLFPKLFPLSILLLFLEFLLKIVLRDWIILIAASRTNHHLWKSILNTLFCLFHLNSPSDSIFTKNKWWVYFYVFTDEESWAIRNIINCSRWHRLCK